MHVCASACTSMLSKVLLKKSQVNQSKVLRLDLATSQDAAASSTCPPEPTQEKLNRGSGYQEMCMSRPATSVTWTCSLVEAAPPWDATLAVSHSVAPLQGVRIGADVYLDTLDLCDWDLITIGSGVAVNEGASLIGHYFKDGQLHFGEVHPA